MNPHIESLCDKFCASIMEHADSVRVFVTWREGICTEQFTEGDGNICAQLRQVTEFMVEQNQLLMERIRKENHDE